MISTLNKAAIGAAFTAAALVGAAAPAHAATTGDPEVFLGVGGATRRVEAVVNAKEDAHNQAVAAGAFNCSYGTPEIDDSDPYFFVAIVEYTCLNRIT